MRGRFAGAIVLAIGAGGVGEDSGVGRTTTVSLARAGAVVMVVDIGAEVVEKAK